MFNPKPLYNYFQIFRKYVGRRLVLVFLLATAAVLVESVGITLVLPLIASLGMEAEALEGGSEPSALTTWMSTLVRGLGLEGSTIGIILFIALLVGLKGLIRFCADAYGGILSAQLSREIKRKMFQAYVGMSYAYYSVRNTGHFANVINTQVTGLIQAFSAFKTLFISILTTMAYFSVALLVDWRFALMAVVFGGTVLLFFRRLSDYVKQLSRQTAKEQSTLNKRLIQCLQAHKYLTATGTMVALEKGIFESIHRLTRYARNQSIANAFTGSVREPISIIVILLVLIVQISFFQAPVAPILVSLILLYRAMGQVMLLQSSWQHLMSTSGSIEVVEAEFTNLENDHEADGELSIGPLDQEIRFEALSFAYAQAEAVVLHEIDLCIPARSTVAFVGPSGAGKSTLVDLITLLLKPTSGRLSIDGNDASVIATDSWRQQIGYVSQDTVIFDDTVANNIGMWSGDFNADADYAAQVLAASEAAHARSFIEALPEGFNTVVGDRGVRLSGGQKQRLFIARELFKQPKLLILDEATSALDTESERAIQASIDALRGEITIILIAHRLSTVRNVDHVYVLETGKLVEQGTYAELIEKSDSRFARMVAAQTLTQQSP